MNVVQIVGIAIAVALIVIECQFTSIMRKMSSHTDALDYLDRKTDYQQGEIEGLRVQIPGNWIRQGNAGMATRDGRQIVWSEGDPR